MALVETAISVSRTVTGHIQWFAKEKKEKEKGKGKICRMCTSHYSANTDEYSRIK
jgi:hypothetical protein